MTLAGGVLSWTGDIGVGGSVTITYSVTATGAGDRQLVNTVTSDVAGSNCPTGGTDPRCRSTIQVLVPGLTVTQTADVPATTARAGSSTTPSRSPTPASSTYTGLTVTESLADVLDDATYNGDATATGGAVSVAGDGADVDRRPRAGRAGDDPLLGHRRPAPETTCCGARSWRTRRAATARPAAPTHGARSPCPWPNSTSTSGRSRPTAPRR